MGRLRAGHLVEAGLWLLLLAALFGLTYKFNQSIEIYKFGASVWPRAILVCAAIAVFGQLFWQFRHGDSSAHPERDATTDVIAENADSSSSPLWYLHTAALIALPFVYLRLPDLINGWFSTQPQPAHSLTLLIAAAVIGLFSVLARKNHVGGMLALPLLFATMLENFGFYSLAPMFMLGVMFFMGERRPRAMFAVMALLFGLLTVLFVSILYVGLPTGNMEPFYTIGTSIVTVLQ